MIETLILGLPDERPGGLTLTILAFLAAAGVGVVFGLGYATLCVARPRASLLVQAAAALLRGVPVILLVFLLGQLTSISLTIAGMLGLTLYSFAHVGEIMRSFLLAYPASLQDQGRLLGLSPLSEWGRLRVPWMLRHAFDALTTHWISLLKDTGALVVLSIGELTTVAKSLSAGTASYDEAAEVLLAAAGLYLMATLTLIGALNWLRRLPSLSGPGIGKPVAAI